MGELRLPGKMAGGADGDAAPGCATYAPAYKRLISRAKRRLVEPIEFGAVLRVSEAALQAVFGGFNSPQLHQSRVSHLGRVPRGRKAGNGVASDPIRLKC